MRLTSIFIRFYKSFNVDYVRQNNPKVQQKPWEIIETGQNRMWYPYIEVPIDPKITAVVGANESGKSHLLSAIEKAISGHVKGSNPISSRDFCRYSERFLLTSDKNRFPDFGTEWNQLSKLDCKRIKELSDIPSKNKDFSRFYLFRTNKDNLTLYLPEEENKYSTYLVKSGKEKDFEALLPGTRRLANNIALPASIPIQKLVKDLEGDKKYTNYELLSMRSRREVRELIDEFYSSNINSRGSQRSTDESEVEKIAKKIALILASPDGLGKEDQDKEDAEVKLTYDLLCHIAKVSPNNLLDLANAMEADDVGYTQALVDKINRQLSANLNFPNYWAQDSKFQLVMSAKDHNIEFTIIDRTGTKYSFNERSNGLTFFLSYFIQHRAYESQSKRHEILLMDEPDAFLSSRAQQDLLKIFEEVVNSDPERHAQVIYVTHSPFLIDKNHAERIRVLDKGSDYEGTRVVKSVSKNHYEPLRSALGAFIAETVYISNCNLMVEGPVDQILLAGASTYLQLFGRASKRESLNLNEITIVPAGGTNHIPYLTYLARGRDSEKPAVIVLVDSDNAGNDAKEKLTEKGYGPYKKAPLKKEFVLQVGDLKELGIEFPEQLEEPQIEDLIPVSISVLAARKDAKEVIGVRERDLKDITEECVQTSVDKGITMFKAIHSCVMKCSKEKPDLTKIGFSRSVIEVVKELRANFDNEETHHQDALNKFEKNFKTLFRELDKRKSEAELERTKAKASQKVKDLSDRFFANHPDTTNREDAFQFLEKLKALMLKDDSFDAEIIKNGIDNIWQNYKIDSDLEKKVDNYEQFKNDVNHLRSLDKVVSEG